MKNCIRRIVATLALAVMLVGSFVATDVKSYAYDNDVNEGVAVIAWYVEDCYYVVFDNQGYMYDIAEFGYNSHVDSGLQSWGTGFFVGTKGEDPQYLITNYHVVSDYVELGEGSKQALDTGSTIDINGTKVEVYLYIGKSEMRVYYSETDYDVVYVQDHGTLEKVDLALLKLREPTSKRHPLKIMKPEDKLQGETVYAVGFPGASDNVLTAASRWGSSDVTVTKGTISKFAATASGVETIEIDAKINHGNSGGPLVTEDGIVVGVNTWGIAADSSDTRDYAINSEHVIEMLIRNNVDFMDGSKKSKGDDDDEEGSNLLLFIIIGVVALVVIVGVVVVIIVVTSSKKSAPQPSAARPNAGPVPTPGAVPNQGAYPAQQAAPQKKPLIRSMSNQHNGVSVPLGQGSVLIGRDPSSVIRFKEGTAGVSGRHAQVQFDQASGDFLITDLRSSYGTFLLNGQKLEPNVPYHLKAGESFYVGDKANIIRVEIG